MFVKFQRQGIIAYYSLLIMTVAILCSGNTLQGRSGLLKSKKSQGQMVLIPSGKYIPFFKEDTKPLAIKPFYIDIYPVTNKEFLEFIKANPKWQRSKIKKIFADDSYLKHWENDLELGVKVDESSPVTNVSWFAANAYAEWKGKRLPTLSEWEYAASASEDSPDGIKEEKFKRQILEWYSKPTAEKLPVIGNREANYYGVYDMHGLVWEWVEDFNSVMISGESRGGMAAERNFFCGSGSIGTADPGDYAAFMRFAMRSSLKGNYSVNNLGFRCAKDIK